MIDFDTATPTTIDPATITQAPTQAAPPWQNLNPLVNAIAAEQGVEIGSPEWLAAGPAAWSGQSGAQGSYGWKHDCRVTPDFVRAVIANYGSRRCYYLGAPFRQWGYDRGGRPIHWLPESPGDLPDGSAAYVTEHGLVIVSGPDAEHFWLEPLWAVIDQSLPWAVPALGKKLSSKLLARQLAKLLVSSLIGQIRNRDTDLPNPWTYGDRANSRILSTIIEAAKRGCLPAEDVATAVLFVRDVLLPFYEKPPGISEFGNNPPDSPFVVGLFNGLYWILPVMRDARELLMNYSATQPLAERCDALITRWSQWMLDIAEMRPPEHPFAATEFVLPRDQFITEKPLGTLKGTAISFRTDPDNNYEAWAYRACCIAARVTGSDVLVKAAADILERQKGDPDKKVWLVDADGNYADGVA